MPRPLRIEYAGAIAERTFFSMRLIGSASLNSWGRSVRRMAAKCYCLISNHWHAVVETPQPNLAAGMRWLLGPIPKGLTVGMGNGAISSDVTTKRSCWMVARGPICARCVITSISIPASGNDWATGFHTEGIIGGVIVPAATHRHGDTARCRACARSRRSGKTRGLTGQTRSQPLGRGPAPY